MCFYEAFSFAVRMDVVPGRVTVNNNLLVVYRESVNPIGYITVDYQLIGYGEIVARVIVYVTLFQT